MELGLQRIPVCMWRLFQGVQDSVAIGLELSLSWSKVTMNA
jgi:hypothetical protein